MLPIAALAIPGVGDLKSILEAIFGQARNAIVAAFARAADVALSNAAAKQMARAIHKPIAGAMGVTVAGVTLEQRIAVGLALAGQAAATCDVLRAAILEFGAAQAERERTRGTAQEAAGLARREAAEAGMISALHSLSDAASGEPLR